MLEVILLKSGGGVCKIACGQDILSSDEEAKNATPADLVRHLNQLKDLLSAKVIFGLHIAHVCLYPSTPFICRVKYRGSLEMCLDCHEIRFPI